MKEEKPFRMEKDYDFQNDSLFMYITDEYEYKESIELGNNIILDFDKNDAPVAIEILDAAKVLNVEKFSLNKLKGLIMEISIEEDTITIKAEFKVLLHQMELDAPISLEVPNDLNLPQMQTEFALA